MAAWRVLSAYPACISHNHNVSPGYPTCISHRILGVSLAVSPCIDLSISMYLSSHFAADPLYPAVSHCCAVPLHPPVSVLRI